MASSDGVKRNCVISLGNEHVVSPRRQGALVVRALGGGRVPAVLAVSEHTPVCQSEPFSTCCYVQVLIFKYF